MTQEEKFLLFQDLSARLPYGVKVRTNRGPEIIEGLAPFCHNQVKIALNLNWSLSISDYTPYLRPMSSMTEEEQKELEKIIDGILGYKARNYFHSEDDYKWNTLYEAIDWLNAHHFDYRGLIEKGLALEAPENMHNLENKLNKTNYLKT
jgi:hypothetical protein